MILPISFEYSDVAGDTYPDTPDPIAFATEYAAGFGPVIPRNSIFRAGNVSGNQQQGSSMIPELYELGGTYPYYYAAFDRVDPGGYASIVFRMQFPDGSRRWVRLLLEGGANDDSLSGGGERGEAGGEEAQGLAGLEEEACGHGLEDSTGHGVERLAAFFT